MDIKTENPYLLSRLVRFDHFSSRKDGRRGQRLSFETKGVGRIGGQRLERVDPVLAGHCCLVRLGQALKGVFERARQLHGVRKHVLVILGLRLKRVECLLKHVVAQR